MKAVKPWACTRLLRAIACVELPNALQSVRRRLSKAGWTDNGRHSQNPCAAQFPSRCHDGISFDLIEGGCSNSSCALNCAQASEHDRRRGKLKNETLSHSFHPTSRRKGKWRGSMAWAHVEEWWRRQVVRKPQVLIAQLVEKRRRAPLKRLEAAFWRVS